MAQGVVGGRAAVGSGMSRGCGARCVQVGLVMECAPPSH